MSDVDILAALVDRLHAQEHQKPFGTSLIGFDGYIDRVVRLKKNQHEYPDFFEYIGEFSQHIQENKGKSLDITVRRLSEKIGGNGPLMAESLAAKNVPTICIGAMGYPEIHPVFDPLSKICRLISVEQPAFCLALEFSDAKIMLGETEALDRIDWEKLIFVAGEENIISMITGSDIVGFTNWSGLSKSNNLLRGILQSVCPRLNGKKRILFFDLADPSCKSEKQFADFFQLVEELSCYFDIILGLNAKETVLLYNHYFNCRENSFSEKMIQKLVGSITIREIVAHDSDWAVAADKENAIARTKSIKTASPVMLTGAGDNFNAGYCLGKLCFLDMVTCMYLGNISASFYVKHGFPATIHEIIAYIEQILHTRRS
jgi:hypothetical protein